MNKSLQVDPPSTKFEIKIMLPIPLRKKWLGLLGDSPAGL
jgi:hypothetical protein